MENYLLYIVGILLALALFDLVVGVSNDAVNFLNSALGSKAAKPAVILGIASVGVFAGALFSNGMMEIARKGVFFPEAFSMNHIFIIFLAVMITDILLLDLYNSLGLPTSTTVSIVFELLGASFVAGLLLMVQKGEFSLGGSSSYVNFGSTVTIISGIFLSILLAFVSGNLVHSLVRYMFTFNYKKNLRLFGAPFAGVALTAIIYFLLIKGLKGTTLVGGDFVAWITSNTGWLLMAAFAFFSILTQVLMWVIGLNPLRLVVLVGTFALAMAFAGNDLVNFIGVPIAGLQVYLDFTASGVSVSSFSMAVLLEPAKTSNLLLLLAGAVMVVTIWVSAKARKVTETEIGLARQDEGDERFKPNRLSRFLVGRVIEVSQAVGKAIPERWNHSINRRFLQVSQPIAPADAPAFDLVRASVNLVVSSILIALATSFKLPLSTTYVTFMVAMGSSLADGSWGRESAVYRVAGVINVISGWLLTAVLAFFAAGVVAAILWYGQFPALIALLLLAAFLVLRSFLKFRKEEATNQERKAKDAVVFQEESEVIDGLRKEVGEFVLSASRLYRNGMSEFLSEKTRLLEKTHLNLKKVKESLKENQQRTIRFLRRTPKGIELARLYVFQFDLLQDIYQSIGQLLESTSVHLLNKHHPPSQELMPALRKLVADQDAYFSLVVQVVQGKAGDGAIKALSAQKDKLQGEIFDAIDALIALGQKGKVGNRQGAVSLSILLETKDLNASLLRLARLFDHGGGSKP